MLQVNKLECIRGERRLFKDLGFQVEAGSCLLVQGANGSGKTSLLRLLAGLTPVGIGEVRWNGERIERLGDAYRRALLYCGHLNAIKEELTAAENLAAALALSDQPATKDSVRDALRQAGLKGREDLPVQALSQGQKRRVNLARLLLDDSALWILDEPFTALDLNAVQWLSGVVDGHLARGGVAVMTSHQDISLAGRMQVMRLGA
jgi:heme exporter protein A